MNAPNTPITPDFRGLADAARERLNHTNPDAGLGTYGCRRFYTDVEAALRYAAEMCGKLPEIRKGVEAGVQCCGCLGSRNALEMLDELLPPAPTQAQEGEG